MAASGSPVMAIDRVRVRRPRSTARSPASGVTPQDRKASSHRKPHRFERQRSGSAVPLDRISMLIMEANEINQCLKKDYHFARHEEVPGDEEKTTIQVTNKKFGISCLWSLAKLKERLMKMRKLVYAGDVASLGYNGESVFYDPEDKWEKVPLSSASFDVGTDSCTNGMDAIDKAIKELAEVSLLTNASYANFTRAPNEPKRHTNRQRPNSAHAKIANTSGHSTTSSNSGELPAESAFILPSATGPGVNCDTLLPEKYLICSPRGESTKGSNTSSSSPHLSNSVSKPVNSPAQKPKATTSTSSHGYGIPTKVTKKKPTTEDAGVQTEAPGGPEQRVSVLTICKEMMKLTVKRLRDRGGRGEEGLVDRILISCESIKVAVINILEAYTQAQEVGQCGAVFADSDLVRITSMQLVTSLELLVSQACLWVAEYTGVQSQVVQDINNNINKAVHELASELLSFIQGCENHTDSLAHESSARILSQLYELVRNCGQLAMATDVCPSSLKDLSSEEDVDDVHLMVDREEDVVHIFPSSDLKQAFLIGADCLVDHTLEHSMTSVDSYEKKVEMFTFDNLESEQQEDAGAVLKHVYIVIATCKLMLYKCREIQVELDAEMQEDCMRQDNYYYQYFRRCQSILDNTSIFTDNLTLLVQAAEPLVNDPDPGVLRKVSRCSEIIQRTCVKLLRCACVGVASEEPDQNCTLNQSVVSVSHSFSTDLQSLKCQISDSSILSQDQYSEIMNSAEDVQMATNALTELAKKQLTLRGSLGDFKVRRMLPATPSNIRSVVRPKSAKTNERKRMDHKISTRDVTGTDM